MGPPPEYNASSVTNASSLLLTCSSYRESVGKAFNSTGQDTFQDDVSIVSCPEAMLIAQQLLRSMQLHLEPKEVVDPLTAYSYAGLACSFIEGDPSYALHVLCRLEISDIALLKKLIDTVLWCGTHPSEQIRFANDYEHAPATLFDINIIADAITRTLAQTEGEAAHWQLPFVDSREKYTSLADPKPMLDPRRTYTRFLDVRKITPPWTMGATSPRQKAVVLMLDTSGSMGVGDTPETTRLAHCVRNMLMVFEEHVGEEDFVSFVEFNNRVVTRNPMAKKKDVKACLRENIERAAANGGTAFFDSMVETIGNLAAFGRTNPGCSAYILALTDGSDQHSRRGNERTVLESLRANPSVTPLIIGAGSGLNDVDVQKMRLMAGEVPHDAAVGGMYISASDDPDRLREAFETAAAQMAATPFEQL